MFTPDLGTYMLMAIIAMAICMAITPIMIRLAPLIGMMDSPDSRKVHAGAIPRSGGIGMVIGMMTPLLIWLELDGFVLSFLIGTLILLLFGAWDDSTNLKPRYKFIGQILAAAVVVYYGDVYVYHFPFMGLTELPAYIGKPFTVIAIVGMINALNLSDGLDGLAGGEALISLAALAYLAYQYDGFDAAVIAVATIGGIFGFLKFNSHPARIFMGDAGSQTLGFVLGVLVVYLSQNVNPVISPVVPLLLLGLPLADCLVVFFIRARRGDSLVVPTKDHLHHRLMSIGFYHYESVIIIYTIQTLFVFMAIIMPYESDALIFVIYLSICFLLYSVISLAEKNNWKAHKIERTKQVYLSGVVSNNKLILNLPNKMLEMGLSLALISAPLMSNSVPADILVSSIVLLAVLIIIAFTGWLDFSLYRLVLFIALGSSVYLVNEYPPDWLFQHIHLVYIFYILMIITAFIAARLDVKEQFRITPLDYLVLVIAVIVAIAPDIGIESSNMTWMAIQMIILFYSAELLIQSKGSVRNGFSVTLAASIILVAARGIM